MKTKIFRLFILLLLLPLPAAASLQNYRVIDTPAGLNIRSTPSTGGRVITAAPYKAVVRIVEQQPRTVTLSGKQGRWIKIQWKTNYGWVFDYYTKKVNRGLAGLSFRSLATHTDFIPQLYFKNNTLVYYTWSSVGSTGYRLGRYTVSGNTLRVSFFREVILINQTPPTDNGPARWKKTVKAGTETQQYTVDLALDHRTGYYIMLRSSENFKQLPGSILKEIQAIDRIK